MPVIFTTVASGYPVSGDVDLRRHALYAVSVPGIDSADMVVHGAYPTPTADVSSADFQRILNYPPNSGDMSFATGPGSRMVLWDLTNPTLPYMRFGFTVDQTDTRTLMILTR